MISPVETLCVIAARRLAYCVWAPMLGRRRLGRAQLCQLAATAAATHCRPLWELAEARLGSAAMRTLAIRVLVSAAARNNVRVMAGSAALQRYTAKELWRAAAHAGTLKTSRAAAKLLTIGLAVPGIAEVMTDRVWREALSAALHASAKAGRYGTARWVISTLRAAGPDEDGDIYDSIQGAAMWAVEGGHLELAERLLREHSAEEAAARGRSGLHIAAVRGKRLDVVKALYASGPISEWELHSGLVESATYRQLDIFEFLLDAAPVIDTRDRMGLLYNAAKAGARGVIAAVLERFVPEPAATVQPWHLPPMWRATPQKGYIYMSAPELQYLRDIALRSQHWALARWLDKVSRTAEPYPPTLGPPAEA